MPDGHSFRLTTTDLIARQNDQFRRAITGASAEPPAVRGDLQPSASVSQLPQAQLAALFLMVGRDAPSASDASPERESGFVTMAGVPYAWSLDYLDATDPDAFGSDDPCDPTVTFRRLRIMHAAEY